ncbi:MAG: hypothetical protein H6Q18_303 [Bacteroidetes bacterium]|nr:hypothetical protein [Bacteroidota bacterium]
MSEEIITDNHWLVITNPKAGKRKLPKQREFIINELTNAGIPYLYKETEYSGHAIEIAKQYTRLGCSNFLVLGGDGTISEVINGIFTANTANTSKIKIALIPRGTGNDWGRFWTLKKNDRRSMSIFLQHNAQLIDIGKIDYKINDISETRYFINSVGFGLDANVIDLTHRMKKYTGSFSFLYTIALLAAVFNYKSSEAEITINEQKHISQLFTMNIANGCYSGGGIKQNPSALPYDGIFDMIFVEKPSFKDIITALPLIFNGKLTKHPIIQSFKTKSIDIKCNETTLVEADGILVSGAHSCQITIIPNAIQMIVPKSELSKY